MKQFMAMTLLFSVLLQGAPAFKHERTFMQPDGSTFQGHIKGDEYLHWIETEDGRAVVFNPDTGRYETAVVTKEGLTPSGNVYKKGTLKKARGLTSPERQELHRLWLEKRAAEMRRRQE
jgi:hypothetical protein